MVKRENLLIGIFFKSIHKNKTRFFQYQQMYLLEFRHNSKNNNNRYKMKMCTKTCKRHKEYDKIIIFIILIKLNTVFLFQCIAFLQIPSI